MCRVLREFPSKYSARDVTVVEGGTPINLDLRGTLFDSVWDENVGSKIVKNMALTPSLAVDAVDALYMFNQILVEHGDQIFNGSSITSYSSDFNTIYNRVYRMLISSDYTATPKLSYAQKGFTMTRERLGEIDGVSDNIGIYELGKYIAKTDIITQLRVMHGYISSKPWQDSTESSVVTARSYAAKIETAVLCVIDTVLDIAHAIDGFAVCVDRREGGDENLLTFDPEADERYMEVPAI